MTNEKIFQPNDDGVEQQVLEYLRSKGANAKAVRVIKITDCGNKLTEAVEWGFEEAILDSDEALYIVPALLSEAFDGVSNLETAIRQTENVLERGEAAMYVDDANVGAKVADACPE